MKSCAPVIGTLILSATVGAAAQKVYRCGPGGSVYQQAPCSEGIAVDVSDPRTSEQRQQAQEAAKSDARAAAKFDREMMAASSAKSGKVKPEPTRQDKAASSPKAASKKAEPPSKPLVFLVPLPKGPASAAKR